MPMDSVVLLGYAMYYEDKDEMMAMLYLDEIQLEV